MNKNRLIYIAVAIALLMTGGFTFHVAIDTASIMSSLNATTQWIETNQSLLNPADARLGAASQSSPDPYLSPDNFIVVPK